MFLHGLTTRNPWTNRKLRWIDWILRRVVRKKALPLPANPQKILLANIAHLGDVVIATTVLPALQQRFPQAEFGFLAGHFGKAAALGHPMIRHVHTFHHFWRGGSLLEHILSARKARAEISRLQYDLAIDLHPYFPNAIPFLHRCKLPQIVGYTMGGFSALLTHPYAFQPPLVYMGQMHLEMLHHFGIETKGAAPRPFYPSKPLSGSPYGVVHMGTSKRQKEWRREAWIECVQKLKEYLPIVLTGKGPKEVEECAAVAHQTGVINLADQLDWGQFAATIQGARLLLSVDSAAVHLAAASQTPTIVLFSGVNSPHLWAPRHPHCKVLMKPVPCAPCFNKQGCPAMRCIQDISPDQVVREAQALLSNSIFY